MITKAKKRTTEFFADQRGFTLVELLCAVAVGVLAAALITLAVRVALKSWRTESGLSEALILCDTLTTAVQDELSYARDISGGGSEFDFISDGRANGERCTLGTNEKGLPGLFSTAGEDFYPLVREAAFPKQLQANVMATWDGEAGHFEVFISVRTPDAESLASANFCVEPYNLPAN